MKVHRTVRYRLHPGSNRKHQQLHGTAGACRFVKQKSGLNRQILASGWGTLELGLNYKMEIRKVSPAYTSQTCHQCGHVAKGNRPSQSEFKCAACGHADDADVNAALNILASGNGAAGRGGGDIGGDSRHVGL